ncbi:hypothetical protein BaRGS_00021448 [Batillaria attramentaria]|uniref:Uncharacterized protein n=1 Tax=Batillaria attramentaria TaxID=370345 RepID=A0ABD0KJT3_9CAEN
MQNRSQENWETPRTSRSSSIVEESAKRDGKVASASHSTPETNFQMNTQGTQGTLMNRSSMNIIRTPVNNSLINASAGSDKSVFSGGARPNFAPDRDRAAPVPDFK